MQGRLSWTKIQEIQDLDIPLSKEIGKKFQDQKEETESQQGKIEPQTGDPFGQTDQTHIHRLIFFPRRELEKKSENSL